jgi:hypothetical protein
MALYPGGCPVDPSLNGIKPACSIIRLMHDAPRRVPGGSRIPEKTDGVVSGFDESWGVP